jgi:murein L,D-transpeptidase YcbB/YkuD
MYKTTKLLMTTVAAIVALTTVADAESRIFREREKRQSSTISGSGQIKTFNFWGLGWNSNKRKNQDREFDVQRRAAPPEKPKVYTYRPDSLYTIADKSAQQPQPPAPVFATDAPDGYDPTPEELRATKLNDSLAQTIFDLIKSGDTGIKVTEAQRNSITRFYKDRTYAALWTSMEGLEERGSKLLDTLRNAHTEGLSVADYAVPVMEATPGGITAIETDLQAIARLDIQLTALAVRYAQHASGGRIVANRLSAYHDMAQSARIGAGSVLEALATSESPADYLASLHPTHAAYAALKAALADTRSSNALVDAIEPVPNGPTISPGEVDDRIPLIRDRLIRDGHLEEPSVEVIPSSGEELPTASPAVIDGDVRDITTGNEQVYGQDMIEAVKAFQRSAGLVPDGIIGRRTVSAFNGRIGDSFDKSARIIANMERLRWLPRHLGREHIFVNQASYQLNVMRNNQSIWNTRVIVGKPTNQTSFFSDEMETVVFNPYWGVPQSIITKEMLPKLVNDPSYLDRLGYEVYNGSGRRVSSSSVDWWNYYSKVPFGVRQPPGRSNALGEVKFLFPNKHAIYLHDTPTKKLFDRPERAFSHGCVRVQNPRLLAEKVLGWDQTKIASHIESGQNQQISLKRKIPVHLTYFTAWPAASGDVAYYRDMYGRDSRLETAFAATSASYR